MDQLLNLDELKKYTPEQQQQILAGIKQQAAISNAQGLITLLSEKCTKKCIINPGSSLSGQEKQCIQRCLDRFVESFNIVTQALQVRLQQESNSQAAMGSPSSSMMFSSDQGSFS